MKALPQSHAHHYVPRWYQRRFLAAGQTEYYCLDLHPETIIRSGAAHSFNELHKWGTKKCFFEEDLYALRLGAWSTDEVERLFFEEVDRLGREAVELTADYRGFSSKGSLNKNVGTALQNLVTYMGAQRFRTPRGLDLIKKWFGSGHNETLRLMMDTFQIHTTVWTEAVWEIVRARRSSTKFIVTDAPVTFYNKSMFPSDWLHPGDADFREIGTRTIFPLGPDSCFILTLLQLVRNPRSVPTMYRRNWRAIPNSALPATRIYQKVTWARTCGVNEVDVPKKTECCCGIDKRGHHLFFFHKGPF
jgi:hypothetical protein